MKIQQQARLQIQQQRLIEQTKTTKLSLKREPFKEETKSFEQLRRELLKRENRNLPLENILPSKDLNSYLKEVADTIFSAYDTMENSRSPVGDSGLNAWCLVKDIVDYYKKKDYEKNNIISDTSAIVKLWNRIPEMNSIFHSLSSVPELDDKYKKIICQKIIEKLLASKKIK